MNKSYFEGTKLSIEIEKFTNEWGPEKILHVYDPKVGMKGTKDNVDRVKAKMVVEAANIPVSPEIEEVLRKRGVLVVPDILANAGGVISSYAEYRGYNPKQMLKLVQRKIRRNTRTVLEYAEEKDMGLWDGALNIAKERIRRARSY